jgi:hypothetical protein
MSEDDDFARVRTLELLARSRSEDRAAKVVDVLLADLRFDVDGPLDDACKAIDEWGSRMDAAITENLDHESINSFVKLVSKQKREIEMAYLARERHAKFKPAIAWVRAAWIRKATEYSSKKEFAQDYTKFVIEEFPELQKVTPRTISENWLKGLSPKKNRSARKP